MSVPINNTSPSAFVKLTKSSEVWSDDVSPHTEKGMCTGVFSNTSLIEKLTKQGKIGQSYLPVILVSLNVKYREQKRKT